MYELFTGRRAHNARTMPERVRELDSEIDTPSNVIRDIDPAVERIILRCLANDPSQRPRSAREVIESLPGGDPLAAALAAGETPSPRVVAAAGSEGSLKPWQAWTLLAAALVLLAVAVAGRRTFGLTSLVSFEKAPDVLVERGVSILRSLSIPPQPYRTHGFRVDAPYMSWIIASDRSPRRWERLRGGPAMISFAVYESTEPVAPQEEKDIALGRGTSVADVDLDGRLVALAVVPRREWAARPLDWKPLFDAAGLDLARFTPARTQLVPATATDTHAAWSGRHPDDGTPIHVEAAAWRGTPVFFRITGAWQNASLENLPFVQPATQIYIVLVVVTVVLIGLLLAWRNLRLRRGDRQSALRVAGVVFALELAARLLAAGYQPSFRHTIDIVRGAAGEALLWAAILYVLYLALEPFARRRWPAQLIASSRLLAGNHRDPMVGRDALIGIVVGLAHTALIMTGRWLEQVMEQPAFQPLLGDPAALAGTRFGIANLAEALSSGALEGFVMMIVLVTFMLLLRRRVLAGAGLALVMLTGYSLAMGGVTAGGIILATMFGFAGARYGLLTLVVAQASFHSVFHYPLFASASWQSIQLLPLVFVLLAAAWAFHTSLGGQPAFAKVLDE